MCDESGPELEACPYCEASNKDLADAWRKIVKLEQEMAELRNTLELYRNTIGVKV